MRKEYAAALRAALFRITPKAASGQEDVAQISTPNRKQEGETYHHWGLRICAIANGSCVTLVPYLHNVYNYIYNDQVQNKERQEQEISNVQNQIGQEQNRVENIKNNIESCQSLQHDVQNKIIELNSEKKTLKNRSYEVNKEARMKMILGLVILIPLTCYLFLFYSSTFYSAFFKNFENAYGQLDLNRINIHSIDDQIEQLKNQSLNLKNQERNLRGQLTESNNNIADLTNQINNKFFINKAEMRTEMNNFFSGWMAQMNVLGMSVAQQNEATQTFNGTLNNLLGNKGSKDKE